MGAIGAKEVAVELAWEIPIGGVTALTGQEAVVLAPALERL
jgi:hypothetical protein